MNTSLTAKGAALLAACDRATLSIDERALACLSKADAAALRRALAAIVDSFDEGRYAAQLTT